MNITVLHRKRTEQKSGVRKVTDQPWQCSVDTSLPHERSSPLANRTEPHATKAGVLQFELSLPILGRIAGKADVLTTLTHSFRVAMVARERTRRKDFCYIIGFSPVLVPRFVLGRNVGQILIGCADINSIPVDFATVPMYCNQIRRLPRTHVKPPVTVVRLSTSTVPGVLRSVYTSIRPKSLIHNNFFDRLNALATPTLGSDLSKLSLYIK